LIFFALFVSLLFNIHVKIQSQNNTHSSSSINSIFPTASCIITMQYTNTILFCVGGFAYVVHGAMIKHEEPPLIDSLVFFSSMRSWKCKVLF